MGEKRVSLKEIKPILERMGNLSQELYCEVEKMPICIKRKSLLVTLDSLNKKLTLQEKEISEERVMAYVNKHPEVLQKMAHFAASDSGAKEISSEIVSESMIESEHEEKHKTVKKRKN